MKIYRDLKVVFDTAFDEGKLKMIKAFKNVVASIETITKATRLTKEEIEKL